MRSILHTTAVLLQSLAIAALIAGPARAADKVDVNSADAATIDRVLLNIGPSKAQAIVAHRDANGPYNRLEQLAKVKGIGLKTVEKNRDRIDLGGGAKGGKSAATTAAAESP
jgi:competence protein ComEA